MGCAALWINLPNWSKRSRSLPLAVRLQVNQTVSLFHYYELNVQLRMNYLPTVTRISALLFILALAAVHALDRTVDSNWQPISDFALGDWGWLLRLALLMLGTTFLSLGVDTLVSQRGWVIKIGAVLLLVAALGNFTGSLFNTDPVGTKPEDMTTSGQIHAASAGLLGFMILATIFYTLHVVRSGKGTKRWYLLTATLLLWVAEISLVVTMASMLSKTEGMITRETPFGWHGRVLLVLCAGWGVVCSVALNRSSSASSAVAHNH